MMLVQMKRKMNINMKKTIILTESELTNIIKKIINEDLSENTLYSDIKSVIRDSNSSNQETIEVLKSIIDEMESSRRMRRDVESRFRK